MPGDSPGDPTDEPARPTPSVLGRLWRRWGWVIRWTGTLLGVLYVCTLIHFATLRAALATVSVAIVLVAALLTAAGQFLGAVRWRTTLTAYGAQSRPSLATAARLYLVALFYNSFLPGAVAGDVVRAVVTRQSFADHGTTGALAVVFVERLLGLFALFALVIAGVLLSGDALAIEGSLRTWSIIGGVVSLAATLALPLGRRLARFLPAPLARIAHRLPTVERPGAFVTSVALSLCTQVSSVIAGWLILRALHPGTTVGEALLIIPAGAATTLLPITVGGTGAREAMFVLLCGKLLGMASEDAVAASLLLWLSTLLVGGVGGLLLLVGRGGAVTPTE